MLDDVDETQQVLVKRVVSVNLGDVWHTNFKVRCVKEVLLRVAVDAPNRPVTPIICSRRSIDTRDQVVALLISEHDSLFAKEQNVGRNMSQNITCLLLVCFDLFLIKEIVHV